MQQNELELLLKQYWGYDQFRGPQIDVIQSIISGKNTLAILPTGGGKSICYQIPALALQGITLVISPLIALMRDQVQQLQRRGIQAEAIHSALPDTTIDRIYDNARFGKIKLLYVSPERLQSRTFLQFIDSCQISLLAIDEAHCISQWGYDFRPSYLLISEFLTSCPKIPIIALTASATKIVQSDIVEKLGMKQPNIFISSVSRQELSYQVKWVASKSDQIISLLKENTGSAIIYMRSRKKTQDLAFFLKQMGFSADFYHAGLEPGIREKKQDVWIQDKSRIMVATNAFGMGIDKPNVRLVLHVDIPESIESYYQEAGRAGRDGESSAAYLLFNPNQWEDYEERQRAAFPELSFIQSVYQSLCSHFQIALGAMIHQSLPLALDEFCKKYNLPANKAWTAIQLLEQAGWVEFLQYSNQASSIEILITAEELIQFQHKTFQPLLQALLRIYPGLFNFSTEINENKLSVLLKCSVEQIKSDLDSLQHMGILIYHRKEEGSRIIFLKERVVKEQVQIDQKLFQFRKDRMEKQLASMKGYIYGNTCRSNFIASYFNEITSKPCGKCDICLMDKSAEKSVHIDHFWKSIRQKLHHGPLNFKALLDGNSEAEYNENIQKLQILQTEGKIHFENNKVHLA